MGSVEGDASVGPCGRDRSNVDRRQCRRVSGAITRIVLENREDALTDGAILRNEAPPTIIVSSLEGCTLLPINLC